MSALWKEFPVRDVGFTDCELFAEHVVQCTLHKKCVCTSAASLCDMHLLNAQRKVAANFKRTGPNLLGFCVLPVAATMYYAESIREREKYEHRY